MSSKFDKEKMRRIIEEEKRKLEELVAQDPAKAVQAIIGFYKGIGYTQEEIDKLLQEKKEVIPEKKTEVPEGVELVKYQFTTEEHAKTAEDIFEVIIAKKGEFRSAVNLGAKVRTVMYELDANGKAVGGGSALIMETVDKDTAWHLQQMIDWAYRKIVDIIAIRREGKTVEVAFTMKGLKALPVEEKEKMFFSFKKTDGWTLVGEEKR